MAAHPDKSKPMPDPASDIKSMKLYSHIERVHNELAEIGKTGDAPLEAAELSAFDQLHYHGTDAVDRAVEMTGMDAAVSVLEIGSGFGGPARHIAHTTGARITALELQPDQNALAASLSARCGLANITHICGDVLHHDWRGRQFGAIVSWLALYHIAGRARLWEICGALLPAGGAFYAEDLFCRRRFDADERAELASGLYAAHLPDFAAYQSEVERAGFKISRVDDMSDDWSAFTGARLDDYRAARERHIRVHGVPAYASLEEFYQLVHRHFRSGKLGGIRLLAHKA